MTDTLRTPAHLRILFVLGVFALFFPFVSRAQSAAPADLSTTIRAELLSDPRTSSLSSAQLDAMVQLLTQKAQAQGITASDITWHPQQSFAPGAPVAPVESCAGNFTCTFDEAFGFVGPDTSIPFLLGMASMGLIWIIAEMIHRHKYPHLFAVPAAPSGM